MRNNSESSPYVAPVVGGSNIYESLAARRARLEAEQRQQLVGGEDKSSKMGISTLSKPAHINTNNDNDNDNYPNNNTIPKAPSNDDYSVGMTPRGGGPTPSSPSITPSSSSSIARRYRSNSESSTTSTGSTGGHGAGRYKLSPSASKTFRKTVNDYGYEKSEFTVFGNVAEDDEDEDGSN
jgi:hypothetical protein